MPRVIAGAVGGRRFVAPPGGDTRPTSERVREALFSALAPELAGAAVLDLFAGSGALAIEALSRGAARAVLVEADRRAAATALGNLEALGLSGGAVVRGDARAFCAAPAGGPFHIVLADPPYAMALADCAACVADLAAHGALARGAVIVIERSRHDPALSPPVRGQGAAVPAELVPAGVAAEQVRTYGDTVLAWWRAAGSPDESRA